MAQSRYYSSIAQQTTLTSGVTPTGTTIIVASTAGFPGSVPYTLALDYGSASEELVEVTGAAGLTLTVTRSIDGTSGSSHNPGAVVRHVSSARDFTDSRIHEGSVSGVHGVSGAVVGTTDSQILTNKTLTRALGSMQNATFYNVGAVGITQIIGDSTNPNANRLEIKDNEVALNTLVFFQSTGAIKSVKTSGEADNVYKLRITDNDSTTDRFSVLAGGTLTVTPTAATTFVPLDVVAPDLSTAKRTIRVAASGGGSERFTVWNDGRVDIVGSATNFALVDIVAPAAMASDILRVQDSALTTQIAVQQTGKLLMNRAATVVQPGITSGTVLQVGGSNVGYTGDLQQWVSPANTIVGRVTEAGNATFTGNLTTTGLTSANGGLIVQGIGQELFARKVSDTSRASTITATPDPVLQVSVAINATYTVEGYVVYNANTTGDFGMQFGVPAGATGDWSGTGWGRDATASVGTAGWTVRMNQNTITQNRTFGGDTTDLTVHVRGVLVTAGTAGTFSLDWAQAVVDAGATIVRAMSYIYLRRVA